jgi:CCR4-NOT transcription complex subunit 6
MLLRMRGDTDYIPLYLVYGIPQGSIGKGLGIRGADGEECAVLQDNVALIAVLEAIQPPDAGANAQRQLICVANTHIHANPELSDVKLWQVHTLLKGLEKIAAR